MGPLEAPAYSTDEMMTVAAARELADGQVCFVGIGLPSTASNLARALHAPRYRAHLRVGRYRLQTDSAAALDRRRRARRDGRRRRDDARDIQLLAAGRSYRRRHALAPPRSTGTPISTQR